MEIYIKSNDSAEFKAAASSGICTGIVLRQSDFGESGSHARLESALKLSNEFSCLHIDVNGKKAEAICYEAHRVLHAGLAADRVFFRFPATWEGIQACKSLTKEGYSVHIDAVGTVQQAWLAMEAGAQWIGISINGLKYMGTDAFRLSEDCLRVIEQYSYDTRLMLDGIQSSEQIAAALNSGVDGVLANWKLIEQISGSIWSSNEAQHRLDHTRLLRVKVGEVVNGRNPAVNLNSSVKDALREMSRGGMGAVALVDESGIIKGIFTDGDLRRMMEQDGELALAKSLQTLPLKQPISIDADAFLVEAQLIFRERKIDNLLVTQNGMLLGMIDIQDLNG
jgi:CBS-domain-containing membrane protein